MGVAATEEVAAAPGGGDAPDFWLPWTFRRVLALPGSPLAIGAVTVLLWLILDGLWFNAAGAWHGIRFEGQLVFLQPWYVFNLSYAVFFGFGAVALCTLVRRAERDVSRLGPALELEGTALGELRRELLSVPARSLRVATAAALAGAAVRLPGLIAYESRVAAVSDWLVDARALGRVGLYLLIPVASWVGGALVERLVDAALG